MVRAALRKRAARKVGLTKRDKQRLGNTWIEIKYAFSDDLSHMKVSILL